MCRKLLSNYLLSQGTVRKSCKISLTYVQRVRVNSSIACSTCDIDIYLLALSQIPHIDNNRIYLYNLEIFAWKHPRDQMKLFEKYSYIYIVSTTKTGLAWLKTIRLCNHLAWLLLKYKMLNYTMGRIILSTHQIKGHLLLLQEHLLLPG